MTTCFSKSSSRCDDADTHVLRNGVVRWVGYYGPEVLGGVFLYIIIQGTDVVDGRMNE